MSGLFTGIKDVKPRGSNNWFGQKKEGVYIVRVDSTKTGANRNRIPLAIINMTVVGCIESNCDKPHMPGEEVVVIWKAGDYFLRNIKDFIAAAVGVGESDVDEEACEEAFGDSQPLKGQLIQANVREITLKKKDSNGNVTDYGADEIPKTMNVIDWQGQPSKAAVSRLDETWVADLVSESVLERLE